MSDVGDGVCDACSVGSVRGLGCVANYIGGFDVISTVDEASASLLAKETAVTVLVAAFEALMALVVKFVASGSAVSDGGSVDGIGTVAQFNNPYDVAIDPTGTYALVADTDSKRIRRISLSNPCSPGYYCPLASSNATCTRANRPA